MLFRSFIDKFNLIRCDQICTAAKGKIAFFCLYVLKSEVRSDKTEMHVNQEDINETMR